MPPPQLPPKDRSSFLSPSSNSYINSDLADAVRDSVQIRSASSSNQNSVSSRRSVLVDQQDRTYGNNHHSKSRAPLPPSLDPLVPRRTPSPNPPPGGSNIDFSSASDPRLRSSTSMNFPPKPTHSYSQSSPDMSTIIQPALPSTRMQQLTEVPRNPFEEDEIEPSGMGRIRPPGTGHAAKGSLALGVEGVGQVPPSRAKFVRAHTGASTSISSSANLLGPSSPTGGKTRARRSMSSDSYAFTGEPPAIKELTAGQRKALEDKKGSRHADVIDTWDPTGLGSAMWHHAGPYDAAAPSRNANLPYTKAPMQAFNKPPIQSPPRTGPTTISLSSPPAPPVKDIPAESSEGEKQQPKRAPHGSRQGVPSNARRVTGGGLTGQYSTSMPASGGYFPEMGEQVDEAEHARRERQRERESKRRALKAAWGIDTPEPFEDFGGSPNDGTIEIVDDIYSPESVSAPLPGGRPMRSPGLRLGLGGGQRSPPIREDSTSPTSEYAPPSSRSGQMSAAGPGSGGVKRTKSLMQKFKTMRESPNIPLRGTSPKPYSPGEQAPPVSTNNYAVSTAVENFGDSQYPIDKKGRPNFFSRHSGRSSPQKQGSGASSTTAATAPPLPIAATHFDEEPFEESEMVPDASGSGFVIVESPSSKARAMRALRKEQASHSSDASASAEGLAGVSAVPANRVKHLPAPPVAPVIPDFDDFLKPGRGSPVYEGAPANGGDGLKRKTSMVKKLKDRMAK